MFDIEGIAQMVNIAIVEDEAMYAKQLQEFLQSSIRKRMEKYSILPFIQTVTRSYISTSHSLILF